MNLSTENESSMVGLNGITLVPKNGYSYFFHIYDIFMKVNS